MREAKAMIHSKSAMDTVNIISEKGYNNVVAEYQGKRYTAIFNPFAGCYFVDDVYGEIMEEV